jgi:fusion and transport protein UGO1
MDTQPAVPQSHPLRPYSVSPSLADWQPASSSLPTSSASSSPAAGATSSYAGSGATRSVPPSLRLPPSNRYDSSVGDLPDAASSGLPNAGAVLRAFVTTSLLSFTGVAMVQPFEVGKTLAQVQWVPRDGVEPFIGLDLQDDTTDEQAVS